MQLQDIMYPNTDVEMYIYMCIHLVWGYNLVWGYCIANQNHCMTTNLCLGFLFWKHTAFNQTQTMVGTTCLSKNQATISFVLYLIVLLKKLTKNSNLYLGLLLLNYPNNRSLWLFVSKPRPL